VHGGDVRLVDPCGEPAVTEEAVPERRVGGERGQQDPERDGPVAAGVPGAVDLARAPATQQLVQLVVAEGLERQERLPVVRS
jgi:hypothetical protein